MPDPNPLTETLAQATAALASVDPFPFTTNAFARLQTVIRGFITDLIDESWRIAKRHKSEVVSEGYVDAASTYLIASRTRRLFRHMGTLGGILLGGSLSNILSMLQAAKPFPVAATLASLGIGILGTF